MGWKAETIYNAIAPGTTLLIIEDPTILGVPPKQLAEGSEILVMFGSAKPETIKVLAIEEQGADIRSASGIWHMTPRHSNDPAPPYIIRADWANRQEWVVRHAVRAE
jgi:hypothetical protein